MAVHGEYKVPGGKLVVVDLEVRGGLIAEFRLAGDFFLEPDSALDDIDRAVTGLPETADATTIAAAVRAALPDGAQLLGFSPEAVGTAVRRALVTAPGWADFDWEIVHEKAVSPRMNLALDEVLTARVAEGRRRPTLRMWEWDESAVVIGSFQQYTANGLPSTVIFRLPSSFSNATSACTEGSKNEKQKTTKTAIPLQMR